MFLSRVAHIPSKHSLSRRILVWVVLTTSLCTLVATAVQLRFDYRRDISLIHSNIRFIEESYITGIAASSFEVDEPQLMIQLQGALNLPDIKYLEVQEKRNEYDFHMSVGNPTARRDIARVFPLSAKASDGRSVECGTLTVVASFEGVYQRLWDKVWVILATNAVKLFPASLAILLIIELMLTRHLNTIADFVRRVRPGQLDQRLALPRRPRPSGREDELDKVVAALNEMEDGLRTHIEQRRDAELALRNSESRFRTLVANTPSVIFRCGGGPDLSMNFLSESFRTVSGYSPEDFVDPPVRTFRSLIHAEDIPGLVQGVTEALETKSWYETEFRIIHRDGTTRWIHQRGQTIVEDKSAERWFDGVMLDITARKQAEDARDQALIQLHQSQKMEAVGRLAGGIAHDFNNLLTCIIGHVDLVLLEISPESPSYASLQAIQHAARSATNLTQSLLSFGRKSATEKRTFDLNKLIRNLNTLIGRLVGERIAVRLEVSSDHYAVQGNPDQVEQAIVNLVVNACDAMPNGGALTIRTERVLATPPAQSPESSEPEAPFVMLSVQDTGEGIDEAIRRQIFEPFFTTKPKGRGTGLGLSMVYNTVSTHGGFIDVASRPTQGSTFRLYFPEVSAQSDGPHNHADLPHNLRGSATILTVEDDPDVRALISRALGRLGYRVLLASNGAEALIIARDHSGEIDLVFTDVVMPVMDGAEMVQRLQQMFPNMKVIFSSGYPDEVFERHGISKEQVNFLSKPFTPQDLVSKIVSVLGSRQAAGNALPRPN